MGLATTLAVGGGLLSAFGSVQEGESNARADEYNASTSMAQAKTDELNAKYSLQDAANSRRLASASIAQATQNEATYRRSARRVQGKLRAAYGASGVTLEGSPLEVAADQATEAELDALNIRFEGQQQAYQYRQQATQFERQAYSYGASANANKQSAAFDISRAEGARAAGVLGAVTAGISAGSTYAAGKR